MTLVGINNIYSFILKLFLITLLIFYMAFGVQLAGITFTLDRVILVIGIAIVPFYLKRIKISRELLMFGLLVMLYIFITSLSISLNTFYQQHDLTMLGIKRLLLFVLEYGGVFVCFYVFGQVTGLLGIQKVEKIIVVCIVIVAIYGIAEFLLSHNVLLCDVFSYSIITDKQRELSQILYTRGDWYRSFATFTQPMEFAAIVTLAIPLLFCQTRPNSMKRLTVFIVLVIAILVSGTRSIFALVAMGTVGWLCILPPKMTSEDLLRKSGITLIIISSICLFILVNPNILNSYFAPQGSIDNDSSINMRINNLDKSLDAFYDNPILGKGLDSSDTVDCFWIKQLAEVGVIGTSIYLLLLVYLVLIFLKHSKHDNAIKYYLVIVITFILLNVFMDASSFVTIGKLFWVLVGLGFSRLSSFENSLRES